MVLTTLIMKCPQTWKMWQRESALNQEPEAWLLFLLFPLLLKASHLFWRQLPHLLKLGIIILTSYRPGL